MTVMQDNAQMHFGPDEPLHVILRRLMACKGLTVTGWPRAAGLGNNTLKQFFQKIDDGQQASLTYRVLERLADAAGLTVKEMLFSDAEWVWGKDQVKDLPDGRRAVISGVDQFPSPPEKPDLMVSAVLDGKEGFYHFNTLGVCSQMVEIKEDFNLGEPLACLPEDAWHTGYVQDDDGRRQCYITGIIRYIISPCNTELEET